jgi:type IV secretion system protein VirB7
MTLKRLPVLAAALLALAGCATHGDSKPAICDGKHRRPANPNGSVLTMAPPSGAATATPKAGVAIKPAPGPQSSIDPGSFQPCGARA